MQYMRMKHNTMKMIHNPISNFYSQGIGMGMPNMGMPMMPGMGIPQPGLMAPQEG